VAVSLQRLQELQSEVETLKSLALIHCECSPVFYPNV